MPHFTGIYLHIKSTESQLVLLALPEKTNITKPSRVLGRIAARWWWSWNFPKMELADFYDWAYRFLKLCRSNQSATLLINGNKLFKLGKAIRTAQLAKGLWFFIPRRYKGGFQSSPSSYPAHLFFLCQTQQEGFMSFNWSLLQHWSLSLKVLCRVNGEKMVLLGCDLPPSQRWLK